MIVLLSCFVLFFVLFCCFSTNVISESRFVMVCLDVSVSAFYTGGCTIDELGETCLVVGCCLEGMLTHFHVVSCMDVYGWIYAQIGYQRLL